MLTFPPRKKIMRTPTNDRAYSLSFCRYFRAATHYEPGSGSTASAPACANGAWPPLRPVSMAQNKPSTMSSSTVQSIDPRHGLHRLMVLDDETTEWLLNTCLISRRASCG